MKRDATFSPCRTYRYTLTREWEPLLPMLQVVGLNPSTADETTDDPTIRRCIGFARTWGCGSLVMTNLFAFVATDPDVMKRVSDPIGPENDAAIAEVASRAGRVLAAWSFHGRFRDRDVSAVRLLPNLMCLGRTKNGLPRHPLYMRADTVPVPFTLLQETHP